MRRTIVGTIILVGVMATAALASGDRDRRQHAVFYLTEPTLIGSVIVSGPVLFTHDEGKMARGGPCTTVYLADSAGRPGEEIASFHCIPLARTTARTFTVKTERNEALGFGCVLTEFQFAGDSEGHGVPTTLSAVAAVQVP